VKTQPTKVTVAWLASTAIEDPPGTVAPAAVAAKSRSIEPLAPDVSVTGTVSAGEVIAVLAPPRGPPVGAVQIGERTGRIGSSGSTRMAPRRSSGRVSKCVECSARDGSSPRRKRASVTSCVFATSASASSGSDRSTSCGYRLDVLVERRVVVELLAIERSIPMHAGQVLTDLKLCGVGVGLLVNINVTSRSHGLRRLSLRPASCSSRPFCWPSPRRPLRTEVRGPEGGRA
jgi:hypothetical protein